MTDWIAVYFNLKTKKFAVIPPVFYLRNTKPLKIQKKNYVCFKTLI